MDARCSTRMGTPRSLIKGGSVLVLVSLIVYLITRTSATIVTGLLGVLLCLNGALSILLHRRLASKLRRLVVNPIITVALDSESISISSKDSYRRMEWHLISHVQEAEGFLLLFSGTLSVGSFPLSAMTEQQKDFIKSHVRSSKNPTQPVGKGW